MSPHAKKAMPLRRWLTIIGISAAILWAMYYMGGRLQPGGNERYLTYPLSRFELEGRVVQFPLAATLGSRMFVTTYNSQIYVLRGRDPGDGCLVKWDVPTERFVSPCKGGAYARDGAWLSGPAQQGLDRFVYTITEDSLVIDTQQVVPGQPAPEQ